MAFRGQKYNSPLIQIKKGNGTDIEFKGLDAVRASQLAEVEKLLEAVDSMHQQVYSLSSRTNVREINFGLGDFVLKANTTRYMKNELSIRWMGPLRVTKVLSNFLFEVEDLLSNEKYISHGTKLKMFRNKDWTASEDIVEHLKYQQGEYCVIDELVDIRTDKGEAQVLVRWTGFDDEDPE